jgi:hypothetical protein
MLIIKTQISASTRCFEQRPRRQASYPPGKLLRVQKADHVENQNSHERPVQRQGQQKSHIQNKNERPHGTPPARIARPIKLRARF